MTSLFIDTSNNKKTIVRLEKNNITFEEVLEVDKPKADSVLELIEVILKKTNTKLNEVEKISVNKGPGSFTGLRVGVSIANALAFALGVPINNKHLGEIEEVQYE